MYRATSAVVLALITLVNRTPTTIAAAVHADDDTLSLSRRIVNGIDAEDGDWPWFTSIRNTPDWGGKHFCGGTLIRPDVVATAAHCMVGERAEKLQINVGSHVLSDANSGELFNVVAFKIHENYNKDTLENDIAIIRLSQCVVGVIPLDVDTRTEDELFNGANALGLAAIIGHGVDAYQGGSIQDTLQEAEVTVLKHAECQSLFGQSNVDETTMICGSTTNPNGGGNVDACQGDSGGPFVTQRDGTYVLTGITSWGFGCADVTPGVYTRVSQYTEWIRNNGNSTCSTSKAPTSSPMPAQPSVSPTTSEPTTTPVLTSPPTSAPTVVSNVYQGFIAIGQTLRGDTDSPGVSKFGSPDSPDHTYNLNILHARVVKITTCSYKTKFDTILGLYLDGVVVAGNDDGNCGRNSVASTIQRTLQVGMYMILIEGYDGDSGEYSLTVSSNDLPPPPTTSAPTSTAPTASPISSTPTASPFASVPTPAIGCRMLECGRVGRCSETETASCEDPQEPHDVRCCSDVNKPGWTQRGSECPWTESNNFDGANFECQGGLSFFEASQFCADVGGRLCTQAEVQDNCAFGTGCGFDVSFIWTSTGAPASSTGLSTTQSSTTSTGPDVQLSEKSCDELGWTRGFGQASYELVCGESFVGTDGACAPRKDNYANAVATCEDQGARVCSTDELKDGAAFGSGCGLNAKFVWSSTDCVVDGSVGRVIFRWKDKRTKCKNEGFTQDKLGVRCCADVK